MSTVEQYEAYVKKYTELIYSKVALKLGVYKAHTEILKYKSYDTIKSNPLHSLMTESIQIDCVMSISKLIEPENRGARTFSKFLSFTEGTLGQIRKVYPSITQEFIDKQRDSLDSIENEILNILTQRDKYFAHADNTYFLDSNKIITDFPNTYNELVKIVQTLQNIIGEHNKIINGSTPVCMSSFAFTFSEKTLHHIIDAEKAWYKEYRTDENW